MYHKILICLFLIMSFCYSCSDGDNNEFVGEAITITVKSSHTFQKGEAIGLYVEQRANIHNQAIVGTSNYKTNVKWIHQEDGSWQPATANDIIYTPADGHPLDIYAYYPYVEGNNTDKIEINDAVRIMTGNALAVKNISQAVDLFLNDRTSLVKVCVPNLDILSSTTVRFNGVKSGGIINLHKIGKDDDFEKSTSLSNVLLMPDNGAFITYLPNQIIDPVNSYFEIDDNGELRKVLFPDLQISSDENTVIFPPLADEYLADLPNAFMLNPGNEIFISVKKAYRMWRENPILASTSPNLDGKVEATIVWQENLQEVIEDINIGGEKEEAIISIKTKAGKTGNALVAVSIGGTIRWSWHLWVTDYNPKLQESETINQFNGLTFMNRNLGATSAPSLGGDRTFGLLYQWGRKDPFQGRGDLGTIGAEGDVKSNLANSIVRPSTFISSATAPNDWYAKTTNQGNDRWNSAQNTKTAFDPCPKGWKTPVNTESESPWTGLSLPTDENKWGNGWYFDNTPKLGYYPAAGQRTITGTVTYAGSAGFYHTATPDKTMRFDFTTINLNFQGGRASARSVRCVKE